MTEEKPALYEGVNELQDRVFPSSERRGGCAIKKMLRSLLMKRRRGGQSRISFTIMTTPSAPLRRLRAFFLLAQPPLLFQEGNTLSWQFIHTFIERRYSTHSTVSGRLGLTSNAKTPPSTYIIAVMNSGILHEPRSSTEYPITNGAIVPPRFANVFMQAVTVPAASPPMS